jgi:hypothetical protein
VEKDEHPRTTKAQDAVDSTAFPKWLLHTVLLTVTSVVRSDVNSRLTGHSTECRKTPINRIAKYFYNKAHNAHPLTHRFQRWRLRAQQQPEKLPKQVAPHSTSAALQKQGHCYTQQLLPPPPEHQQ